MLDHKVNLMKYIALLFLALNYGISEEMPVLKNKIQGNVIFSDVFITKDDVKYGFRCITDNGVIVELSVLPSAPFATVLRHITNDEATQNDIPASEAGDYFLIEGEKINCGYKIVKNVGLQLINKDTMMHIMKLYR
jgi:hypothetical protein